MLKDQLKHFIQKNANEDILIHSDVLFGFKIQFQNREQFFKEHINQLKKICHPVKIIMPVFNYDFCRGETYDMRYSKSQVGALSEYFRKQESTWRTSAPVFNFAGSGAKLINDDFEKIDPFGNGSIFGYLYDNKGLLLHYGSGIHTTTLIHYAERMSNVLIYRYDKIFKGQVVDMNNCLHMSEIVYHVRPMGLELDYDWPKIEEDLIINNILKRFKEKRTRILIGRIDLIVDFWLKCLKDDPFYFLNPLTKKNVIDKYHDLKRPFKISDFELYEKRD